MDYKKIIESHYNKIIKDIKLIDNHFDTEIYVVDTDSGRFIVKKFPVYMENVKYEGYVTEFLYNKGIKVARLLKTKNNNFVVVTTKYLLTMQEFIIGKTFEINTAPDWFMIKCAESLGKINHFLCDYDELPINFGKEFFCVDVATQKRKHYENEFLKAKQLGNIDISLQWQEQIIHINKISTFVIDTDKLTYTNSHGDFHIGQVIAKDKEITIIDWTSTCKLPVCLEVITSYVFASPSCKNGVINAEGLRDYIRHYTKYFPLKEYDIKIMPYVFYFWHCMCNYTPPYDVPENYKAISNLILNSLNWLYDNVDKLSQKLCIL